MQKINDTSLYIVSFNRVSAACALTCKHPLWNLEGKYPTSAYWKKWFQVVYVVGFLLTECVHVPRDSTHTSVYTRQTDNIKRCIINFLWSGKLSVNCRK